MKLSTCRIILQSAFSINVFDRLSKYQYINEFIRVFYTNSSNFFVLLTLRKYCTTGRIQQYMQFSVVLFDLLTDWVELYFSWYQSSKWAIDIEWVRVGNAPPSSLRKRVKRGWQTFVPYCFKLYRTLAHVTGPSLKSYYHHYSLVITKSVLKRRTK